MEMHTTRSAEETETLAAGFAADLRAGDVITITGDLGAGKTTFVRGACRALGVDGAVTSPTFTIGHRYDAPVPVAHLDLYRFVGLSSSEWGDLEPYFDGTIAFVEWPEQGAAWLPSVRTAVHLEHVAGDERTITITHADDPRV